MIEIKIDKDIYLNELKKVLKYFYEAKATGDKEQIKYFQGVSVGMISVIRKLQIVNEDELKSMAQDAELDMPSVYRIK